MEIVEVFKTDVDDPAHARNLISLLSAHLPHCEINFDLQDCDHILRIAGTPVCPNVVTNILSQNGFECECLE